MNVFSHAYVHTFQQKLLNRYKCLVMPFWLSNAPFTFHLIVLHIFL